MSCMKVDKRIVLSKDVDFSNVKHSVEDLAEADKSCGDAFELLGILVDDLADCAKAESKNQFQKQKADMMRTIKSIEKMFRHRLVYKK